jgi:hypothetical protein
MNNFNTPILFLIFNRLDKTKQVFERIREASPSKLYIASDGSRDNREGEDEKVNAVREYVLKSIDWDCEVKTLFREKNLGCGKAVSQSITWFFQNEEMGIILEDDCVPSISFFSYCRELLEKYKDDTRIYHITGFNPLTYTKTPYSYYFARIQHCWGWATWRRAWNHYNFDIIGLNDFISKNKINVIFNRSVDRHYWLDIFKRMENHEIDTWDYQWTYAIFYNKGICINPAKNLVTNIGFGAEATHTTDDDPYKNNQQRFEIEELKHPDKIKINVSIINKLFHSTNLSFYYIVKNKVKKVLKRFLTH